MAPSQFARALQANARASPEEAEEVRIYTGTAQRFPTLVLALIPVGLDLNHIAFVYG